MPKEHDLQDYEDGCDYFLSVMDDGVTACMTIQGIDVKQQDHILVQMKGELIRYKVEEVDYFAEPPDLCMIALQKI